MNKTRNGKLAPETADANEPQARRMIVTPAMARGWLQKNPKNRKVRSEQVLKYAEDIRAGHWRLNGETIVMASDGTIIDGQHRLLAILEAGKDIETFVAFGIDPSGFETMDQGRSRTPSDVLGIYGYPSPNELASLARLWVLWKKNGTPYETTRTVNPPTQEIVGQVVEMSDQFQDALRRTNGVRKNFGGGSAMPFCWLQFGLIDLSDRDMFFERLTDGQALIEGDAVFAVRRALYEIRLRHRSMPRNQMIGLVTKAWNKYRMHERVLVLAFRADEAWPEPS